ncbi:MAG: hypothetical protein HZA37_01235 [Parcubacteria group bacterium]|nr:hypothetical protein [Parcubacteria group bacterium]
MSVSKQELLDKVEAAIDARLSGGAVQSYSIGGRNLQYVTLEDLKRLRAELKREIASAQGGGRTYAKFTDPT